ncbi:MATE efflux family protein [Abeliophyllum distichum]|uniref:MATE efflux family protein n=1 Tax=Abeliophyllum distichum TaxID=126358 RepID=A0ABD1QXB9_9LAMI
MDNAIQEKLITSEAEELGDFKERISRIKENMEDCLARTLDLQIGMSSATETLCGQAFGAKQYHMMGIVLQRSWLVNLITLTILLPVLTFATPIFKLLGEEESIAKSAGISGAMGALCISSWFLVVGEFVYIVGGWCPDTWKGFNTAALKDMLPVVKLSISSGVMVCLELWYYAILVLLAGYMKNAKVSISAFSICLNITAWGLMVSFGIMGAACVRVANELGRGDTKAVKFSTKVLMSTSVLIGLFFWILCLVFGNKIGYLFTDDEEVAQSVADLSIILAFSVLLGSVFPVLSGIAVGAGLQTTVAIINVVCFYIIGIPIGALLGYLTHLQVKGIWIGMMCGVATQTIALTFMAWRTNWDEEVSKTSARLKKWYLKSPDESYQNSDHA